MSSFIGDLFLVVGVLLVWVMFIVILLCVVVVGFLALMVRAVRTASGRRRPPGDTAPEPADASEDS
ncbi:hypothetical protein [Streptomyces anandii]|uniref:hypothetical protein n=1 Tax=Streptomyces anandii TaxID=285454 RepID=UPI00379684A4